MARKKSAGVRNYPAAINARDGGGAVEDLPGQTGLRVTPDIDAHVNLPGLRAKLAIKQAHLAALLGVDPMTVSRWERGLLTPSPWQAAMLGRLAVVAARGNYWPGDQERRASGMNATFLHSYLGRREKLAADALFEIEAIPQRLCEALAVAFGAAPYLGELRGPNGETDDAKGASA